MCLLNLVFNETAISNQRFHDLDPLLAKCEMPFCLLRNSTHLMRPRSLAVAINITNVCVGLWSSSHSSVACSVVCRIANLLLLATGSTSLQVWACQVREHANILLLNMLINSRLQKLKKTVWLLDRTGCC